MQMLPLPVGQASPSTPDRDVSSRTAAVSILLFWIAYYVSVSIRSIILQRPGWEWYFGNRAAVALAGMGLTWLLYLGLRRLDGRGLRTRIWAVVLLCAPVSAAYATLNYVALYVYDPLPDALREPEKHVLSMWQKVGHDAIYWYFFILSWAALYLALSYAGAVKRSEREAARLRAAAQSAELRALRYQVNPHFLFNTLNSISSLVMSDRPAQAEAMILNLSRFFRTSLSEEPTEDVPLADEISLQRLYLDIEAVRFPERLRPEFSIDADVEDACVPGMILQPLVENAIRHGVTPAREPVTVRIAARRDGDRLLLSVEDDGGGPSSGGTGLGLRNVADRLRARFDGAASMRCRPRPGGGYAVAIDMPLVKRGC